MKRPEFNFPKRTNIEDITPEQAAAINAQLVKAFKRVEEVTNNVIATKQDAFLQVTAEVGGDDRLTEYMQSHLEPGKWVDPDYIAILETIEPGSGELVDQRHHTILDEDHRQEMRKIRSPRNIARLLFRGTQSIRF